MAVRYQKTRIAIAGALAVAVVGGTAYFAEASAPATGSTSTVATESASGFTVQTTTRQQPATTTTVKRTRSS
jgi:hypothetical protein